MLRRCIHRLDKLVIVESPNKVIKIEGILSNAAVLPDWSFGSSELKRIGGSGPEKAVTMATTGHFMELKELSWTPQQMRSKPDDADFPDNCVLSSYALEWQLSTGRKIRDTYNHYVKEKARNISEVIIATDPDREGELIATHAMELFQKMFPKIKVPFTRAYIHSITEDGVKSAMEKRTPVFDNNLATAAGARHAIDRIFGFLGSSVVRHANPQLRSIGRVQTPALILINDRETKISNAVKNHKPTFEIKTQCTFPGARGAHCTQTVTLKLSAESKAKLSETGAVDWEVRGSVMQLASRLELERIHTFKLRGHPTATTSVSEPPLPFTMPTFLAKANRLLNLSSDEASRSLQDLFQMGYITYPRSDSTRVDESALKGIYDAVKAEFGAELLYPADKRAPHGKGSGGSRGKKTAAEGNVEDAHEAIRPTNIAMKADQLGSAIVSPTKQVYDLIRRNTLAAFMKPMESERVLAVVDCTSPAGDQLYFTLEGKHTVRPGWTLAFRQGGKAAAESEMDKETLERGETVVQSVSEEECNAIKTLRPSPSLSLGGVEVAMAKLSTPLPYSEGGLIEELKNNGVGRPSTYPMIVGTLLARGYVVMNMDKRCETTAAGRALVELSKSTFPSLVDIGFTASFEEKLDRIAKPTNTSTGYLKDYPKLTEADVVLSAFLTQLANYITEATKTQRATVAEVNYRAKHHKTEGELSSTERRELGKEQERVTASVPEFAEMCRTHRTFSALQRSLHGYLRENFPAIHGVSAAPAARASSGAKRSFKPGSKKYYKKKK